MRILRRLSWLPLLILFCLLGWPQSRTVAAASDSYASNHLSDYGIPDTVTQVLLDNSLYADGQSPTQKGQTPATFTLADVAQLETVSLADVVRYTDGTSVSTPDPVVAKWIAGATDISLSSDVTATYSYDINTVVYVENRAGTVDAATGALAMRTLNVKAHAEHPAVNFLFQILASAAAATRVNLTGVTSAVGDTVTAQKIIALFQTDRLPKLRTLILAQDQLSNLSQSWLLTTTLFAASADQRINQLDLAGNGMSSFPWNVTLPIAQYLTKLNLAGNATRTITDSLNRLLDSVIDNDGSTDLSDADLEVTDWTTLNYAVQLINADTGTLKLSTASVNAVVFAAPGELDDSAVMHYLNQLTVEAAQKLIDENHLISSTVRTALETYIQNGGSTTPPLVNALTVGGQLEFGKINLNDLAGSHLATGVLTVRAVLEAGNAIYVSVTPWTSIDNSGSSFTGEIHFDANTIRGEAMTVTTDEQAFYTNTEDTAESELSAGLMNVTMTIPTNQLTLVRATAYTAMINWTIQTSLPARVQ